jgi:Flp pilus assembly protein TadD
MGHSTLTSSELRHLEAAQGWTELGLVDEAFAELDNIEPRHRAHPDVLEVRWNAYHATQKWMDACEVARAITKVAPERFNGWWMLSFALHALKETQEAYENLASVRYKFGVEWMLHYNLACYLAQLGRLKEARVALARALQFNPEQRAIASQDPDLEPLRCEIQKQ